MESGNPEQEAADVRRGGRSILIIPGPIRLAAALWLVAAALTPGATPQAAAIVDRAFLLRPDAPEMTATAPALFLVRLETNKGTIVLEARRAWAPHGADRFYDLARAGYYDGNRFFRVIKDRWAQFGINGDPAIARIWRDRPIQDDPPAGRSNVRGSVAFAFAVPNGRTSQVFINLRDNSATLDKEPFVPFARVREGMDVADALNAEYGELAGGGIRSGRQGPLFEGGSAYLVREFPRLDYIVRVAVSVPQ